MSYFVFNSVSSENLGLIVLERVARPSWACDVTEYEIAGNPTPVLIPKDTFQNAELVIRTALVHKGDFSALRRAFAVLNGFGTLTLSDYPDEYMNVFLKPIVPETKALYTSELPIYATVRPFAYAVNPTVQAVTASSTEVNNVGTVFSAPEIRFIPTSDNVIVTVNNVDFSVENLSQVGTQSLIGKEVVIDSEAHVTYFVGEDGRKWSVNDHTFNDYPRLHTGLNYVRHNGNVSEMSINVRERWL